MHTKYILEITCSPATLEALADQGSALVAFSAVQANDLTALPLVWMITTAFGASTALHWSAHYEAYASSTPIAGGTVIHIGTTQPIAPGQIYQVQAGPVGTVANNGNTGEITIVNQVNDPFTCGIQQFVEGAFAPVCALPLFGLSTQTLVPLPQIVLMFTTVPLSVGEALPGEMTKALLDAATGATGSVLSIDMALQNPASVTFDINDGWSWPDTLLGARTIPASQIVSTLIQPASPPADKRTTNDSTCKENLIQ